MSLSTGWILLFGINPLERKKRGTLRPKAQRSYERRAKVGGDNILDIKREREIYPMIFLDIFLNLRGQYLEFGGLSFNLQKKR